MKSILLFILSLFAFSFSYTLNAQESVVEKERPQYFIGYDLGEMAFNRFQNFAGEVGLQFKNDHSLRFVYLNIKLTEAHLSSGFANAVDGDNVAGHWQGYELLYDIPLYHFKREGSFIYGGLSAGYHDNKYEHIVLGESTEHKTSTVGFDIGYKETDVFNVKGLYMNFQIPFRYYFTPLEEVKLGSATVNKSSFDQTISFFVGYQF